MGTMEYTFRLKYRAGDLHSTRSYDAWELDAEMTVAINEIQRLRQKALR